MQLKIAQKILVGYGVAVLCMTAIGVAAYRSTEHLIENGNWVSHTYQVIAHADSLLTQFSAAESATRGFVLTGDPRYLTPFESFRKRQAEDAKALREETVDNALQQRRLDLLEPLLKSKMEALDEILNARSQHGFSAAMDLIRTDKSRELMVEVRTHLQAFEDEEHGLLRKRDLETRSSARGTTQVLLFGSLLGFVTVAWIGILIQRSITRPLAEFQKFVTAVGEGDLTQQSKLRGADELGNLAQGLNRMVAGLKEVASQTRAATDNLNSATVEILASVQQQAAGTAEQAAACQETNATMQQVSQSCLRITERAKQVAATAEATSSASGSGVEAVQSTSRTMESIREQAEAVAQNVVALSEKTQLVGDVIVTVNDIAEQSHLLALNAAIEAAAAGEHGRSFAVVAGEIKNLADQSKEATVQVKAILGEIQKGINSSVMLTEEAVKRVDLGKQQADLAATTIREMTATIQQSLQASQQIVAGTNQQQIGFEHVTHAVKEIGQASEQTAMSTRQMEKAAANLAALGQQLRKSTDRYRL